MAVLATVLALVVVIVRAWQVSVDKKQAARARLEAIEATRQRLRTLADRNTWYTSATAAATGDTPPRAWDKPSPFSSFDTVRTGANGYDPHGSAAREVTGGNDGACNAAVHATDAALREQSCVSDISCGSVGGSSLLAAAADTIFSVRRQTSSTLLSAPFSERLSDLRSHSFASGAAPISSALSSDALRTAIGGQSTCSSDGVTWFGFASGRRREGSAVRIQAGASASEASGGFVVRRRYTFEHKLSDSVLETSSMTRKVLASTPQETITTTREMLAHFNFDSSALHRREAKYVTSALGRSASSRP